VTTPAPRRLRVMHLIHAMDLGGAESVVLEHVRHAGADVESFVCGTRGGGRALEEAQRLGARTLVLGGPGGRAGSLRRLTGFLRRERLDVVNGHNQAGGFFAALAGRMAGVPAIVRTEHSIRHPGRNAALYDSVLEPLLTALTHRVVCVCEAVREGQRARTPWAAGKLVTIPNGISDAAPGGRDGTRAELGLAPDDVAVVTVASLTPAKAQHVLIEAFAQVARSVAGARLFLAGDGPLRAALEEQARGLGVDGRVRFLGVRRDVPALLAAADLFVLSSVREGLSLSLLEAMRAGRPVVTTDAGGNREAVVPGATGLVVPPNDAGALAAAMTGLARDGAQRAAWGRAARRRWEERYTAEHMVRDTEELYRQVLAPRRRSVADGGGLRGHEGR
jgi:L-malate glycosyltransferase